LACFSKHVHVVVVVVAGFDELMDLDDARGMSFSLVGVRARCAHDCGLGTCEDVIMAASFVGFLEMRLCRQKFDAARQCADITWQHPR